MAIWSKSILGSGNRKCNDSEAGMCLFCSKNSKVARVAEARCTRDITRGELREII